MSTFSPLIIKYDNSTLIQLFFVSFSLRSVTFRDILVLSSNDCSRNESLSCLAINVLPKDKFSSFIAVLTNVYIEKLIFVFNIQMSSLFFFPQKYMYIFTIPNCIWIRNKPFWELCMWDTGLYHWFFIELLLLLLNLKNSHLKTKKYINQWLAHCESHFFLALSTYLVSQFLI